ncbi:MAG: ribulose-phosphate 3-epimerase [Patescibacteria group bacterium]
MKIQIAPSILSADFGKLNEEIALVEPYSDRIHFDVMDGHFVPNISFGAPVMKWVKTKLPIDVHLMIENPWRFFDSFVKAGADLIIVHEEACGGGGESGQDGEFALPAVLKQIVGLGVKAGVCIKPKTPVSKVREVLDFVDYVLVMTVEPGFGGQEFMPEMVEKIKQLRETGFKGDVAVDGGINVETGKICADAGANILIAGNYIFGAKDKKEAIMKLRF